MKQLQGFLPSPTPSTRGRRGARRLGLCALVVALILSLSPAGLAAGLGRVGDFIDAYATDAEWTQPVEGQLYALEINANTSIALCARDGLLVAVSLIAPLGDERLADLAKSAFAHAGGIAEGDVERAIESGEVLLSDGGRLFTLSGKTRFGLYLACADDLVWLPMHGGEKRHLNPACSGMDLPLLASPEAADALGFPPCETCATEDADAQDDAA